MPRRDEFAEKVDDGGAEISAQFERDAIFVHGSPAAPEGEMVRAFLLVASTLAVQVGIDPEDFARQARRFARYAVERASERLGASLN